MSTVNILFSELNFKGKNKTKQVITVIENQLNYTETTFRKVVLYLINQ